MWDKQGWKQIAPKKESDWVGLARKSADKSENQQEKSKNLANFSPFSLFPNFVVIILRQEPVSHTRIDLSDTGSDHAEW